MAASRPTARSPGDRTRRTGRLVRHTHSGPGRRGCDAGRRLRGESGGWTVPRVRPTLSPRWWSRVAPVSPARRGRWRASPRLRVLGEQPGGRRDPAEAVSSGRRRSRRVRLDILESLRATAWALRTRIGPSVSWLLRPPGAGALVRWLPSPVTCVWRMSNGSGCSARWSGVHRRWCPTTAADPVVRVRSGRLPPLRGALGRGGVRGGVSAPWLLSAPCGRWSGVSGRVAHRSHHTSTSPFIEEP